MRVRGGAVCCGAVVLLTGAVGGCGGQSLNDRSVLGGYVVIPAVGNESGGGRPGLRDDEPTLRSVSRAGWASHRFDVPVDGTVHTPIRRWGVTPAGGNPRRSGLWPTLESALQVSDVPGDALTFEGCTAWVEALVEVVCLPIELLKAPGFRDEDRRASPWAMYKRYPESGEWTSVSAAEVRPARGTGARPEQSGAADRATEVE